MTENSAGVGPVERGVGRPAPERAALHEEAAAESERLSKLMEHMVAHPDYHCTVKCAKCGHKNYFTLRQLAGEQLISPPLPAFSDDHVRTALQAAAGKHRIESHDFYRVLAQELRQQQAG